MILGVIASAILCQHRSVTAIADWVHAQRATLLAAFRPVRNRLPSESTHPPITRGTRTAGFSGRSRLRLCPAVSHGGLMVISVAV